MAQMASKRSHLGTAILVLAVFLLYVSNSSADGTCSEEQRKNGQCEQNVNSANSVAAVRERTNIHGVVKNWMCFWNM